MSPGVKSCCNPDGHCKTKAPGQSKRGPDCKQVALEHQKGIDLHFDLPFVAGETVASSLCWIETVPRWHSLATVNPSPPDLQALYSTFLI